jgi:hypothetical protein
VATVYNRPQAAGVAPASPIQGDFIFHEIAADDRFFEPSEYRIFNSSLLISPSQSHGFPGIWNW